MYLIKYWSRMCNVPLWRTHLLYATNQHGVKQLKITLNASNSLVQLTRPNILFVIFEKRCLLLFFVFYLLIYATFIPPNGL